MKIKFTKTFFDSWEKLFSNRIYYRLLRLFDGVKRFPREIKWFFQRGFRGYDDSSWWSLNDYLGKEIIRHLKIFRKAKRFGVPGILCTDKNGKNIGTKQGEKRWNGILDKMIFGFESLVTDPIDKEPWKLYQAKKITKREWQRREKKEYEEAEKNAMLFIKYFLNLWD